MPGRTLPWFALAVAVVATGSGSCIIRNRNLSAAGPAQPTGTCEGACDHYLSCKGSEGEPVSRDSCLSECREIFVDPFTLFQFETLECSEAVSFVEGGSGRGPGTPVRAGRQTPTSAKAE